MLSGGARRAAVAFLAAATRRTAAAADPAAFAPTRFSSAIASSSSNSEDDEGKPDPPQAPILPTLAFTRHLTLEATAGVADAPTPPSSSAPLVVFGIDPDVTGALAVVAVQDKSEGGDNDALRAALAAWEAAGGGPEAGSAASAAAAATAAAARSSFALVSVHDTPVEKVAVGKALRSRPDPAAVVALVASAAAAARARLSEEKTASPPSSSSSPLLAVIERPAPGFNNGRLSWLATGYAYGVWRAALAAAGVPVLSVPAAAWKKDLGLLKQNKDASRELAGAWLSGGGGEDDDDTAEEAAAASEEGEATSALTAKGGLLGRKRDHGRAEAALIALWGAAIGRAGVGGRVECEGVATGPVVAATGGGAVAAAKKKASMPAVAASTLGGGGGSARRAAVAAAGAASRPPSRRAASTKSAPSSSSRGPAPPAALPPHQHHPAFLAYTFITDDLVLPDGTTRMGAVGGSGPQAAWGWVVGCRLTGGKEEGEGVATTAAVVAGVGEGEGATTAATAAVVAGVGDDLPETARDWLVDALGPGGGACLVRQRKATSAAAATPRAWQVLEADGRRTQVWRTPASAARTAMLLPGPRAHPPGVLPAARALHAGVNPSRPRDLAWAGAVRRAASAHAVLSLETYQEAEVPPPEACLARLLGLASTFSPNEGELASLVGGDGGVVASARRLMRLAPPGGPLEGVLVRCGAAGAVWVPRDAAAPALAVPAVLVEVRDTTGCGNSFLGAWNAARVVGGADVALALACGAAVAAATAEVVGPPPACVDGALLARARERMEGLLGRVEERSG